MPRVALIGAGSRVFTQRVVSDLVRFFGDQVEFHLVDTDPQKLALAEQLVGRILTEAAQHSPIKAFVDAHGALGGCDYVVNTINVGGRVAWMKDVEIPAKYGVRQTVADTLGIGGIFRALRTMPQVVELCRIMEAEAPQAMLLNYANPMTMVMLSVFRKTSVKALGLCHSVPSTAKRLARYLELDVEDLEWQCAGINHQAWFTQLASHGEDLYPLLRSRLMALYDQDPVRFELMRKFGCFPSESSTHAAEYVGYFLPRDQWLKRLNLVPGQFQQESVDSLVAFTGLLEQKDPVYLPDFSVEYAPQVIHSLETGHERVVAANVENTGLIDNLPRTAVVEVPTLIQGHRILPSYVGALPEGLAALNRQSISVQELTVQAFLEQSREALYHAAFLDPNLSHTLDIDQIVHLVDELIEVHASYLPPLRPSWSRSLPLA